MSDNLYEWKTEKLHAACIVEFLPNNALGPLTTVGMALRWCGIGNGHTNLAGLNRCIMHFSTLSLARAHTPSILCVCTMHRCNILQLNSPTSKPDIGRWCHCHHTHMVCSAVPLYRYSPRSLLQLTAISIEICTIFTMKIMFVVREYRRHRLNIQWLNSIACELVCVLRIVWHGTVIAWFHSFMSRNSAMMMHTRYACAGWRRQRCDGGDATAIKTE